MLSGTLPLSIGELTKLQRLLIENGNLEGTVPTSVQKLRNLRQISLQGNKFNGTLSWLTDLTELGEYLRISMIHHFLVCTKILITLASIVEAQFQFNNFRGEIPRLENHRLRFLDLSNNEISGSIPLSLFQLPELQYLNLENNFLSGTSLHYLEKRNTGSIPEV